MSRHEFPSRALLRAAMCAVLLVLVVGGPAWGADRANNVSDSEVYAIVPLDARVWVGTSAGLDAYRRSDGRFLFRIDARHGLPSSVVRAIHTLDTERIAVGTDRGAVVVETTGSSANRTRLWPVRDAETHLISAWTQWGERTVLLDFEHGIGELVGGDDGWAVWAPAPMVGGMWSSAARYRDTLLLGGLDGTIGLYERTPRKAHAFDDGSSMRVQIEQPILAMAAGETGVALATGDALLWWEHGRIEPILQWRPAAPTQAIHAVTVASDSQSRVWVGTREGDVWCLTAAGAKLVLETERRIAAIAPDGDDLWLGSAGGRLRRVRVGKDKDV